MEPEALHTDTAIAAALAKARETAAAETEEPETDELNEENSAEGADADGDVEDDAPEGDHDDGDDQGEGLDAPSSWPNDQLDAWNELSVSAQEAILARDEELARVKSNAGRELAEVRREADEAKRAQAEAAKRADKIDDTLKSIETALKDTHSDDAIAKLLEEGDTDEAVKLQLERDKLKKAQDELRREQTEARTKELTDYRRQRDAAILALPEYKGEKGQTALKGDIEAVSALWGDLGLPADGIADISEKVFVALRDAHRYRNAQKAAPRPKKKQAQKSLKSSARKSSGTASTEALAELRKGVRAAKGRDNVDAAAAALIAAKRKGR